MKARSAKPVSASVATFVEEKAISSTRYTVLDLFGAPAEEIQAELNRLARDGWYLLFAVGPLHYLERTAVPDKYPTQLQQVPFKAAIDAALITGEFDG
ncbi:MAG: hypothetical protein H6661_10140 [Ardenticatenaceae bacterium]|nr:hypothetical protein [Ardenticatenaceae bacterium]